MISKKRVVFTALVAAIAHAASVRADVGTTNNLKGSDALFDFTNGMLSACPFTVGSYTGTGSANGQSAMIRGTQAIAPMSGFLNGGACAGAAGVPDAGIPDAGANQAQGLVIGLDGISMVGSRDTFGHFGAGTCENGDPNSICDPNFEPSTGAAYDTTITLDASCGGGTYTFHGWRDMLRVLFAGLDNTPAATGTGAAAWAVRDCNSCVRQTIANHYGNFFEGSCTAQSGDVVNDAGIPVANTNTPAASSVTFSARMTSRTRAS
jgi:hypothetical protein